MSLSDKTAQDFLRPEVLAEWEAKRAAVYNELVLIDCLLTYLEKLAAFAPCFDFIRSGSKIFLTVTYDSCFQGALLRLWKLLDGPLGHLHKLTRDGLRPESVAAFDRANGSARVARDKVEHIRKKVGAHRNSVVAHLDLVNIQTLALPPLPVKELRELFAATKSVFESLSPGVTSLTLPIAYLDTSAEPWTVRDDTDSDHLLRSLLRESDAVREPEAMGAFWPSLRAHMKPEDIDQLNHCRSLCDLPPA